ncbi:MAG: efflux RND transporter permease subunit [Rhodobacteraceae bacterium]|nr:MAG: efflux RND transporter permease subunit [Paracoccaceae bacterium]
MLTGFFFRETRVLIMVLAILIVGGLSALLSLGRQEDPSFTNRYASVTTLLPGAEPAVVEALISTAIEDQIKLIGNIDRFSSASVRGASIVSVIVRDSVPASQIDQIWAELRAAVSRASLSFPENATTPEIDTDGIASYTTVIAVEIEDPALSPMIAARFAETVEAHLRAIPQTRVVRLFGLPQEEILVSVDPYVAGGNGVSITQIAAAIRAANDPGLAGQIAGGGFDAALAVSGKVAQLTDLRAIPVRDRGADAMLRIGDLAELRRQPQFPPDAIARAGGNPAILIAAVIEDGAQVDRWMRFVREDIAALSDLAPRGLAVHVLFDQSVYTIQRLRDIGLNMALGMALVVLVLFFTLGWQAAAIVALILPAVTLATLATFRFLDLPLHQMSIAGLIVALGLVVDGAIVTTDTVRRKLVAGASREQAARATAQRLLMPLAASAVTTILAFLPMILLPGNVGDFVSTISIAVSVMLVWSFVLALILTAPMAAALLPQYPGTPARGAPVAMSQHGRFYRGLRFLIARPLISLGLALVLPVLGFVLFLTLTPQFFPLAERNQFHITMEMPAHTGVHRTDDLVQRVDAYLAGIEDITTRYWVAGGGAPAFYYNIVGGGATDPGFAQGMITTRSAAATRSVLQGLQQDLNLSFPEARITVHPLTQGPPVGAPVSILVYGPDLAELRRIGAQVQGVIAALPQTAQVYGGLSDGLPQLRYVIDRDAANLLGLDESAVAQQLQIGLSGLRAEPLAEGARQIPIRVQFSDAVLRNAEALHDLPILLDMPPSAAGDLAMVPLSAIASPRLEITEALVYRDKGERMNFVQAYPRPGVLPEELLRAALGAIEAAGIVIPEGYRLDLGGERRERSSTVDGLTASLSLIVVLSLATLVLAFRSFRLTLGTMIVAMLATGLSLLSVAALGFPFGINALIGVIGSIGVSVNVAIIVFTALQGNAQARAGDIDAMAAEVADGARHIVSTTLTTFGGFLPLLFYGGLFWPPFAAAMAGGVLLSATLAFLFAPAYFRLVYPPRKASRPIAASPLPLPAAAQYQRGPEHRFATRSRHPLRRLGAASAPNVVTSQDTP